MVRVYFETPNHSYADLVAIFDDEDLYMACLPVLEKQAKENRMIVTESIDEEIESLNRVEIKNKKS